MRNNVLLEKRVNSELYEKYGLARFAFTISLLYEAFNDPPRYIYYLLILFHRCDLNFEKYLLLNRTRLNGITITKRANITNVFFREISDLKFSTETNKI